MRTLELQDALDLLAKIVNRSGRAKQTTAEAVVISEIPVELLKEARSYLENFRGSKLETNEVLHATNRVWG